MSYSPYGIETIQSTVKKINGRNDWLKGGKIIPDDDMLMVVMHATAGSTLEGAIVTLLQKGLSYNYIIDRSGKIYKCVSRASRQANHAGNSYGPREEADGVSTKQNSVSKFIAKCSVNDYSVGISFVNLDDGHMQITNQQYAAAIWLIGELKKQFKNLLYVTTHSQVSPRRKVDPLGFPLRAFSLKVLLQPWYFGHGHNVKEGPEPPSR